MGICARFRQDERLPVRPEIQEPEKLLKERTGYLGELYTLPRPHRMHASPEDWQEEPTAQLRTTMPPPGNLLTGARKLTKPALNRCLGTEACAPVRKARRAPRRESSKAMPSVSSMSISNACYGCGRNAPPPIRRHQSGRPAGFMPGILPEKDPFGQTSPVCLTGALTGGMASEAASSRRDRRRPPT